MNSTQQQLEYYKNSREIDLGVKIRMSLPFKWFRHFRFRNRSVIVTALGKSNQASTSCEVSLIGVWSEDYPHGMPLEFLERNLRAWKFIPDLEAAYGRGLSTRIKDKVYLYSQNENLRLDFRTNSRSGMIQVRVGRRARQIDLFSTSPGLVSVYPNRGLIDKVVRESGDDSLFESPDEKNQLTARSGSQKANFTPQDIEWLTQYSHNRQPVSVNNPDWRGILSSARELFDWVYTISDTLDYEKAIYYARLFAEAEVPSITIQGFPGTYNYLVKAIRRVSPKTGVFVIYHGNFLHMREDYDWEVFKIINDLYDKGEIQRVGFVKKGMAEIMQTKGMDAVFIMNIVRQIPDGPSQTLPGGPHIGIWGQPDWFWKKSPYAMLAALKLIDGAFGHSYNVSPRVREFGELLSISGEYIENAIPQRQVLQAMGQMHLNLYVTLTECAPMMPLESLSVGSPCLFGPTTHYFWDNEYLRNRLVVPFPDHSENIAEKAILVLSERDSVIEAYRSYAPQYNQQALKTLSNFLNFPFRASV